MNKDFNAGFYGIAYKLANGQTIISYRGTDSGSNLSSDSIVGGSDIVNGFGVGATIPAGPQATLAVDFYKAVAQALNGGTAISGPALEAQNISLTGHSLGAGLAGYVAAIYHKVGVIFDNMPFTDAAENAAAGQVYGNYTDLSGATLIGSALTASAMLKDIYGSGTSWDPSFTNIHDYYVPFTGYSFYANLLETVRNVGPESPVLQTTLDLNSDVGLTRTDYNRIGQAHDATLIVTMLFGTTDPTEKLLQSSWGISEKYWIPAMFNESVGGAAGGGDTLFGGVYQSASDYAEVMRTAIAYSAINEGTEIFGDIGIRTLFHDATALGQALGLTNVSHLITDNAQFIADEFVQYAGALALNKVTVASSSFTSASFIGVMDGIVGLSADQHFLTLDEGQTSWGLTASVRGQSQTTEAPLHAHMIEAAAAASAGWDKTTGQAPAYVTHDLGAITTAMFDGLILPTQSGPLSATLPDYTSNLYHAGMGHALFIGDSGNDTITSTYSSGSQSLNGPPQYIAGAGGDDVLYDNGIGNTLDGGAGNDHLIDVNANAYGQAMLGGDGNDTIISHVAGGKVYGDGGNDSLWGELATLHGGLGANEVWMNSSTAIEDPSSDSASVFVSLSGSNILQLAASTRLHGAVDSVYLNPESYTAITGGGTSDILYLGETRISGIYGFSTSATSGYQVENDNGGWQIINISTHKVIASDTDANSFGISFAAGGSNPSISVSALPIHPSFLSGYLALPVYGDDSSPILTGTSATETFNAQSMPYAVITHHGGTDTDQLSAIAAQSAIEVTDFNAAINASGLYQHVDLSVLGSAQAIHLHPIGGGTWIMDGGHSVELQNVAASSLTLNNFAGVTSLAIDTVVSAAATTGADTLAGTASGDVIHTNLGNDFAYGLAGNDILYAEGGNDTLLGGVGNDTVVVGSTGAQWLDGGDGIDTADFTAQSVGWQIDLSSGTGSVGSASVSMFGIELLQLGSGADTVTGSLFVDSVYGNGGNDNLAGNAGADLLSGGLGNDTLDGGSGNDTLLGGAGNNTMTGGSGTDSFVIGTDTVAVTDTIPDFTAARDTAGAYEKIDLTAFGSAQTVGLIQLGANTEIIEAGNHTILLANVTAASLTLNNFIGVGALTVSEGATAGDDVLHETPLADTVDALAGNDLVYGLAGNDSLYGNTGNDTLDGGAGADTLDGGAGINTVSYAASAAGVTVSLVAGATNSGGDAAGDALANLQNVVGSAYGDAITGSTAANSIFGGDGNDTLHGNGGSDTIDGGTGVNSLDGGSGYNLIYASNLDSVDGGAGIDTLSYEHMTAGVTANLATGAVTGGGSIAMNSIEAVIGSAYNDAITGNATLATSMLGGAGDDTLTGGAGNDTIDGGIGKDELHGGAGADRLIDSDGAPTLVYGDAGNDVILTGAGADTIHGGADNDSISAGAGNDVITGDSGNDTIDGGAGADTIDGGTGIATLSYANSTAAVNVNLVTGVGLGGDAQGDVLTHVTNVTGSAYNDTITGDAGANSISGGYGNNTLAGGDGNDTLTAFSGNDSVDGGSGNDSINPGDGLNTLHGGLGNDTIVGGAGNDLYLYTKGDGLDVISDNGGTDTLSITGWHLADATYTRAANTSDFVIHFAGSATDAITVGGGLANGGTQFESANFSDGSETIAQIRAAALAAQTTAGNDTIAGFAFQANAIHGALGADSLVAGGYGDTLFGDAGNDTLIGGALADQLHGGDDNDSLGGGSGNDLLYGDNGNDTLVGGAGADTLAGGAGADSFVFNAGDTGTATAADHITDFAQAELDKINLHGFGFTAGSFMGSAALSTTAASFDFAYGANASGAAITTLNIDTNHDGIADKQIILDNGHITLVAGDFTFV